jgi:hypothetical protein
MDPTARSICYIFGCIFFVVGLLLLIWSGVQKRARAGAEAGGFLEGIAKIIDSLAKLFPDSAGRVGGFLLLVGVILISLPTALPLLLHPDGAPKS